MKHVKSEAMIVFFGCPYIPCIFSVSKIFFPVAIGVYNTDLVTGGYNSVLLKEYIPLSC